MQNKRYVFRLSDLVVHYYTRLYQFFYSLSSKKISALILILVSDLNAVLSGPQ